jgi:hypothetical protein
MHVGQEARPETNQNWTVYAMLFQRTHAHTQRAMRACMQGKKLALEQTRIGLMKGAMQKLDNPDTNWSFMKGTKVASEETR